MNSQKINNISSLILAFCAVIITCLVVWRQFFAPNVNTIVPTVSDIPEDQWHTLLELDISHKLGSTAAPVKLIEFSDYQCPFCEQMASPLQNVLNKYTDEIEFIYYHLPLPIHPQAVPAAIAAECAAEQEMFFEYSDLLYENQTTLSQQPWDSLAHSAGIHDMQSFRQCLTDTSIHTRVDQHLSIAEEAGITATPTFIINGKKIPGAITEGQLEDFVLEALNN